MNSLSDWIENYKLENGSQLSNSTCYLRACKMMMCIDQTIPIVRATWNKIINAQNFNREKPRYGLKCYYKDTVSILRAP